MFRLNFGQCRVRKLNGKPALFTIADCESEARRIHICYEIRVSFRASDSKAWRSRQTNGPTRVRLPARRRNPANRCPHIWRSAKLDGYFPSD
jgi:hypothetical protein